MSARGERGGVALNLLLVLALAGLILLHWLVLPDPSQRNREFLPDMVVSVPRDAQAPVPALSDGSAIDLRPPAGTIARGYLPFGYGPGPEEALRAAQELQNPIPADDLDAAARGQFVFLNFCAVCHGVQGKGDGPATLRGVPPPPSLLLPHSLDMRDGQMFHVITRGQGNMASYASQVERDDRWKVILYVRALQAAPPEEPAAAEEPAVAAAGAPEAGEGF